jgi:hypothetical protein
MKVTAALLTLTLPALAKGQDVIRHAYDSGVPIAAALEVLMLGSLAARPLGTKEKARPKPGFFHN